MRFIIACIVGERGSPRMLRAPSARGPNSIRPWNQPTTLPSASSSATCSQQLGLVVERAVRGASARRGTRAISSSSKRGPRRLPLLRRRGRRRRAACSSSWCQTNSAAPSAPPASPAAGWIQRSSNGPSRSSRPLATQLSATPPARHEVASSPVRSWTCRPIREHDLLGHRLDAGGQVHVPLRRACDSGWRGGPPNRRVEPPAGHRQPLAVVEVVHVEPEAAVGLQVDQVLAGSASA